MTDREKYRFDVQGYLVVREFLTPAEVACLNEAIDANREKMTEHEGSYLGNSSTLGGESKRGAQYHGTDASGATRAALWPSLSNR